MEPIYPDGEVHTPSRAVWSTTERGNHQASTTAAVSLNALQMRARQHREDNR